MPDDRQRARRNADSVTLRDHMAALLHALDVRVTERLDTERARTREEFAAIDARSVTRYTNVQALQSQHDLEQQRAIDKVEAANEKRFQGMNEFRGQLKDQAATFITRNEMETQARANSERMGRNEDRIKTLEIVRGNLDGRFWALGVGLGFMVFIVNLAFHFLEMKR